MNASSNYKSPVAFQVVTVTQDYFWTRRREKGHAGLLTLERSDEHVPILDEVFDEFICALQLDFMAFDPVSEVRAVQERVTELQSGESHCASTTKLPFRLYNSAYDRLFIT